MKKIILTLFLFCAVLVPFGVKAFDQRTGENIIVDKDEVVDGNLVVAGDQITVEGIVKGDLFVFAEYLDLRGVVEGDVIGFANISKINGQVKGNIRMVSVDMDISDRVNRNVLVLSSNLNIEEGAEIAGHVTYFGEKLNIQGPINGNLDVLGKTVVINNRIQGDSDIEIGRGQLSLFSEAQLSGDLKYKATKEAVISSEAKILGDIKYSPSDKFTGDIKKSTWFFGTLVGKVIQFLSLIVLGAVFVYFAPKPIEKINKKMKKTIWPNIGRGVIWFFLTPIVCIFLMFTIIGIPLALIGLVFYVIGIYLLRVIVAIFLGKAIKEHFKWTINPFVSMIIGSLAFIILISIPVLNFVFSLFTIFWALGAVMEYKKEIMVKWR